MKRYLIIGDVHLEHEDVDDAYLLVKKIAPKLKLTGVVNLGDMMDFSYVSEYTKDSPGLTEGKRLKKDFDILDKEMKFWSKIGKENTFFEGNHEARINKFLDKHPILKGLLDMRDIVERNGYRYISTIKQPCLIAPKVLAAHGLSFSKYYTAKTVTEAGMSIVTGHAHRAQTYTTSYPNSEAITGYGVGTLGPVNPEYFAGKRLAGHSQSILMLYVDENSGSWDMTQHLIKNNSVIIEGKLYTL